MRAGGFKGTGIANAVRKTDIVEHLRSAERNARLKTAADVHGPISPTGAREYKHKMAAALSKVLTTHQQYDEQDGSAVMPTRRDCMHERNTKLCDVRRLREKDEDEVTQIRLLLKGINDGPSLAGTPQSEAPMTTQRRVAILCRQVEWGLVQEKIVEQTNLRMKPLATRISNMYSQRNEDVAPITYITVQVVYCPHEGPDMCDVGLAQNSTFPPGRPCEPIRYETAKACTEPLKIAERCTSMYVGMSTDREYDPSILPVSDDSMFSVPRHQVIRMVSYCTGPLQVSDAEVWRTAASVSSSTRYTVPLSSAQTSASKDRGCEIDPDMMTRMERATLTWRTNTVEGAHADRMRGMVCTTATENNAVYSSDPSRNGWFMMMPDDA